MILIMILIYLLLICPYLIIVKIDQIYMVSSMETYTIMEIHLGFRAFRKGLIFKPKYSRPWDIVFAL